MSHPSAEHPQAFEGSHAENSQFDKDKRISEHKEIKNGTNGNTHTHESKLARKKPISDKLISHHSKSDIKKHAINDTCLKTINADNSFKNEK